MRASAVNPNYVHNIANKISAYGERYEHHHNRCLLLSENEIDFD